MLLTTLHSLDQGPLRRPDRCRRPVAGEERSNAIQVVSLAGVVQRRVAVRIPVLQRNALFLS